MELFAQFDLRLKHIPGVKNVAADHLSRHPTEVADCRSDHNSVSEDSFERELAAMDLQPEEEGDISEWPEWIQREQKGDPATLAFLRDHPRVYV